MQRLVFVYGINDLTVFHHDSVSQLAGGLQVPACGHRQAAALGRFADFLQKVPAPIRSATIVRSPTVMFLRQGMGLWFGTAYYNTESCPVKPINKAEILKAEIDKSNAEKLKI
jgi:hypothetical protein